MQARLASNSDICLPLPPYVFVCVNVSVRTGVQMSVEARNGVSNPLKLVLLSTVPGAELSLPGQAAMLAISKPSSSYQRRASPIGRGNYTSVSVMLHPRTPSIWTVEEETQEFKPSLGYIGRCCLKNKNKIYFRAGGVAQ